MSNVAQGFGFNQNARWWNAEQDSVHTTLFGVAKLIHDETAWRVYADEYHSGLYDVTDASCIRGTSRHGYEYLGATLPYNVCKMAVDTLQAQIALNRPIPEVLAQRANWTNQKRARKLNQYIEGTFFTQKFFERFWPRFIRDALIYGRGIVKIWNERDKITTERIHPWELFTDPWDDRYGDPRNLYHIRSIDKAVLSRMFARTDGGRTRQAMQQAIDRAPRYSFGVLDWTPDLTAITVDRCTYVEAWHLPSGPGEDDGRHVVVIDGCTLLDEPWTYDYFPFVILNYCEPQVGFFGTGLCQQLEGYQVEINMASEKTSEQHRMSGAHVTVADGAGVHYGNLTNGLRVIGHKPGFEPKVLQMDFVNEHVRQRPRELTTDALNSSGLSQMSVQSVKPSGVTAAVAMETLDDVETRRFAVFQRLAAAACVDIAERYIDGAKRIAEDYGDLAVSVPMRGGLVDLSWSDVQIDGVILKAFNSSLLPQQPAGRLERLQELFSENLIDRATFLRNLDITDLQGEFDLELSDQLFTDEVIEKMLYADETDGDTAYFAPTAYQNYLWGGKRAQQKLNDAWLKGAPEFNLGLLRRYIKQCDIEQKKLVAAQQPPPPPAQGAPAAAPAQPMPAQPTAQAAA